MTNMTISPIQPIRGDYVTKGEFNEKFEEQKEYMDAGFDKLGEQIDHVEKGLGKKIDTLDKKFDSLDKKTEGRFNSLDKKIDSISAQITLLTKTVNNIVK